MIIVPLGIGALAGLAWWRSKRKPHGMTPERKKIYETALESLKEPDKLRSLADAFDKEGLKDEAIMLRKRAALRELPPASKEARKAAFRKGMSSSDPKAVHALAVAFHKQGATGAAQALKKYAEGLPHVTTPAQHTP